MWDPEHKMLIVGPVQGGDRLDILSYSAVKMGELNFDIYAIGSPTTLLEEYDFSTIMRMIAVVKEKLPPGKPVHLFGAGHPLILPSPLPWESTYSTRRATFCMPVMIGLSLG